MKKEKPEEISPMLLPILDEAVFELSAIYTYQEEPYNKIKEMQSRFCDNCHLIKNMKVVFGNKKMSSIVKKNEDFQKSYNGLNEVREADKAINKLFEDMKKFNEILNNGKTISTTKKKTLIRDLNLIHSKLPHLNESIEITFKKFNAVDSAIKKFLNKPENSNFKFVKMEDLEKEIPNIFEKIKK